MKLPLQVTFRHVAHSDAALREVEERSAELDRFCPSIMSCRVAIELVHNKQMSNSVCHVRIDLTVPGDELVVGRDVRQGPPHQDVYVAIRKAFHAARRQLEDYVRRRRGYVKAPGRPAEPAALAPQPRRSNPMRVAEIMTSQVFTVTPDDSVALAEKVMSREHVRHLPVVDGEKLVGIVSQRDVLAASPPSVSVVSEEDDLDYKARLAVSKIMRGFVESVRPDTDAAEAAGTMLDAKISCLPVVDERLRVVGIVTSADYVRLARDLLRG